MHYILNVFLLLIVVPIFLEVTWAWGLIQRKPQAQSNSNDSPNHEDLKLGVSMVSRAYYLVCWYDYIRSNPNRDINDFLRCKYANERCENDTLGLWNNPYFKDNKGQINRQKLEKEFQKKSREIVSKLSRRKYPEECTSYLNDANKQPPGSEGKDVLADKGQKYPFKGYAYCLLHTAFSIHGEIAIRIMKLKPTRQPSSQEIMESLKPAMRQITRAHFIVCWFEFVWNQSPNIRNYKHCNSRQDGEENYYLRNGPTAHYAADPELLETDFGKGTKIVSMPTLPEVYRDRCTKFTQFPEEYHPISESELLNESKKDYPFRTYVHCLIATLRKQRGNKITDNAKQHMIILMQKPDKDFLTKGLNEVQLAHNSVCQKEYESNRFKKSSCQNNLTEQMQTVLKDSNYNYIREEQREIEFGMYVKTNALTSLPKPYQEVCENFLDYPRRTGGSSNYPYSAYASCLKRQLEGGNSKGPVPEPPPPKPSNSKYGDLKLGMSMVSRAYYLVCWYEYIRNNPTTNHQHYNDCKDAQNKWERHILEHWNDKLYKDDRGQISQEKLEKDFGKYSKGATDKLPKPYKDECFSYLGNAEKQPIGGEGDAVLSNDGKMYPFKGYAYCLLHKFGTANGVNATRIIKYKKFNYHPAAEFIETMKTGMRQVTRAHFIVCWYENMRNSNPNLPKYHICNGKQADEEDWFSRNWNKKYYTDAPELIEAEFGKKSKNEALPNLPKIFQDGCGHFLQIPEEYYSASEAEILDDPKFFYPFRYYVHCLITTLRKNHGDPAIGEVKTIVPILKTAPGIHVLTQGMEEVEIAHNSVCRGEYRGDDKHITKCKKEQTQQKQDILTSEYFSKRPEQKEIEFGMCTKKYALSLLPKRYHDSCHIFLDHPRKSGGASKYPYSAYASCLKQQLGGKTGGGNTGGGDSGGGSGHDELGLVSDG